MSQPTLFFSDKCPDTQPFVAGLEARGIRSDAVNITNSMRELKAFLLKMAQEWVSLSCLIQTVASILAWTAFKLTSYIRKKLGLRSQFLFSIGDSNGGGRRFYLRQSLLPGFGELLDSPLLVASAEKKSARSLGLLGLVGAPGGPSKLPDPRPL